MQRRGSEDTYGAAWVGRVLIISKDKIKKRKDNKIFDYEKYLFGRTLSREEECQLYK
jgi:hypothetical protein